MNTPSPFQLGITSLKRGIDPGNSIPQLGRQQKSTMTGLMVCVVWQGKSVVNITTPHACPRRCCGCIGFPTDPSTTFTFDCMINRSQASPHQQGFESFAGRQRFIGTTLSRPQGHGDLGVPAAGNLHPMVSPVTIGAGQSLTPFLKGGVSTAVLHW